MYRKKTCGCRRWSAYTLTEILIAMAVASVVMTGVMQMVITVGKVNFDSLGKLGINRDVRSFTNQLSTAARSTSEFVIYTSVSNLTERRSGQSGDFLVLLWADPESVADANANTAQRFYIRRIIAFARIVDDEARNTGPVVRFEQSFPAPGPGVAGVLSTQTNVRELTQALLDGANAEAVRREVIELTRGLADGRLFNYSSVGRSIVVNGEIYHGNRAREVTNTYNFTISPRG